MAEVEACFEMVASIVGQAAHCRYRTLVEVESRDDVAVAAVVWHALVPWHTFWHVDRKVALEAAGMRPWNHCFEHQEVQGH